MDRIDRTERPAPVLRIGGDDTNADWMGDSETKRKAAERLRELGMPKQSPDRQHRHRPSK